MARWNYYFSIEFGWIQHKCTNLDCGMDFTYFTVLVLEPELDAKRRLGDGERDKEKKMK